MRILIVGAGAIGSNLAEQLASERHDVSVVDHDPQVIKQLGVKLDALVIQGNGASPQILENAGIREAEMVIAVTDSDELNVIVSLLARNYGVRTRIARIRNPEYTDSGAILSRQQLAVDLVINPEEIAVRAMETLIFTAGATEMADLADRKVLLMAFLVPKDAPMLGRTLAQMREIVPDEFLIVAIHRGGQVIIPRGHDQIQAGDRIYVVMAREMLTLFLGQLYRRVEKVRKVVIFGASRMGVELARRLAGRVADVTLIEPRQEACVRAAEELSGVTVLHGAGTDPDLLEENHIDRAQAFCALTEDDANNVMSSLLAKDQGAKKTIVRLAEPNFVPIAERIGLDAAINPRLLAVSAILRFVRAGPILSVVHLDELKAEVQELVPLAESPVVNRPLAELADRLPKGALIGAVVREESIVIPRGDTVIAPGERVIVFSTKSALPKVQKLFIKA